MPRKPKASSQKKPARKTRPLEELYPSLAKGPTPEERLAKLLQDAAAKGIKPWTAEEFDKYLEETSDGPEDDMDGFDIWLRLTRSGGKLPQGCSPAEKLAAFEMLAEMQGIQPIQDTKAMTAEFWPAKETADDLVAAVRALRRHDQ